MTTRILVTGSGGQLGIELARLAWPAGTELLLADLDRLDITDQDSVARWFAAERPDAVINAAAYTAVDRAEQEVAAAWAVNAVGPALLAAATKAAGVPIVHVSTDYVFDGSGSGFRDEDDPPAPLGVYGASKLGSEIAVRTGNPRHAIVRTAWLFSAHRANFVKTMLRAGAANPTLRVVADQHGCPTSAADLAQALATMTLRMIADPNAPTGTYHFVNAGEASWHCFAEAIFAAAAPLGGPAPEVAAIATADYPTPARRPANSRLATARIARDYGVVARPWQAALGEVVAELMAKARPRS